MLQKAQTKAIGLVMEAGIPVPSQMELILAKAASNAKAIASLTSGETAPSAATGAAAPVAKEEEKKEEEDTAAGLGALFG